MEIRRTLALHAGTHVIDRDNPAAGEHTLSADPRRVGGGQYLLCGTDGWCDVCGAEHCWLDVTP